MKFLRIFVGIIVILALIIVVGSLFLPQTYSVSRSSVINAPDSVIYKNIANFNHFYEWNPWAKMEPTAKVTFSGMPEQPGHTYEWAGKEAGSGSMKIIKVEPNREVDIDLMFKEPYESHSDTKFNIEPDAAGSKVTWTMSGNHNIISKWMCVFMGGMDKMIGKDFEAGLKSLKEKSEKGI